MLRISRKGGTRQQLPKERVWKCAAYARLSLEDNGHKGADTIQVQVDLVSSYVSKKADLSLENTYIDNGASGKNFDRHGWNRLMDDIKSGRIDCICVKDLSRFSRNYIETFEFLEKIFPFMGIRFISINDGYDSFIQGSKNEDIIIALKSLVHSQYLKDISRKKSSSNKVRRERGEYTGSFAPLGYKVSKTVKGKLEVDENTADIVSNIFNWRHEGMSLTKICEKLESLSIPRPSAMSKPQTLNGTDYGRSHFWNPRTVRSIIANPVYIGHLISGKTQQSLADNKSCTSVPQTLWHIKENTHEAIVDTALWESANNMKWRAQDNVHNGFIS